VDTPSCFAASVTVGCSFSPTASIVALRGKLPHLSFVVVVTERTESTLRRVRTVVTYRTVCGRVKGNAPPALATLREFDNPSDRFYGRDITPRPDRWRSGRVGFGRTVDSHGYVMLQALSQLVKVDNIFHNTYYARIRFADLGHPFRYDKMPLSVFLPWGHRGLEAAGR